MRLKYYCIDVRGLFVKFTARYREKKNEQSFFRVFRHFLSVEEHINRFSILRNHIERVIDYY